MSIANAVSDLATNDEREALNYLLDNLEDAASHFRIGTRNLRGGKNIYNPGVLHTTDW